MRIMSFTTHQVVLQDYLPLSQTRSVISVSKRHRVTDKDCLRNFLCVKTAMLKVKTAPHFSLRQGLSKRRERACPRLSAFCISVLFLIVRLPCEVVVENECYCWCVHLRLIV